MKNHLSGLEWVKRSRPLISSVFASNNRPIYSKCELKMMETTHPDGLTAITEFRNILPMCLRVNTIVFIDPEALEYATSMELCRAVSDVYIPTATHQLTLLEFYTAEEFEELEAKIRIEAR